MEILTNKNKKWKYFKDADGNTYTKAVVDGYRYGDRMLEGVLFNIEIDSDGYLNIQVQDSDKEYFSQLNEEHWYTLILTSVVKHKEATIQLKKNYFEDVELVELGNEDEFENYFDEENNDEDSEATPYEIIKLVADAMAKASRISNDPSYREMAVLASDEELNGNGNLYPNNTNISEADAVSYIRNIKAQLQAGDDMITATLGMWNNLFTNGTITNQNGSNTPPQIMLGNTPLQRNQFVIDLIQLLDNIEEEITGVKPSTNSNASTSGNVNPASVSNLNNAIHTMNNGKTNITANPVLSDLGIGGNDDVDPEFEEYSSKLESFQKYVQDQLVEKQEELTSLNQIIDRDKYWEVFYTVETYTSIINKFFDKEYLTHPKDRLKKIQTFLEEITYKFNSYLVSISYKIKTEEDIEAYEKEHIAKTLLTEHFSVKQTKKEEPKENIDFAKVGANITEEKKSKLSDLLKKIEAGESLEKEKETGAIQELSEYDKADLKGKIAIKYKEVHARAIVLDGEEDGLIKTYVETLYNPETTSLDDKNLLLNLLIVSKMQDISIMKWDFDEKRVKVSNTEIDLKHSWWTKILTEDIEQNLKYVKIVEKDLNLAFYTSLFSDLLKKADKLAYGERNLKFKKLLAEGDEDLSRGGLLLDTLLKKTHEGSVLFITPDMEKHVQTETIVHEELGDKGQIRYLGIWKQRHVFVINVEKIRGLEQYSNEIIFLNKGNSYVLNPEKPIVYFNVIENPFLERPIIKWYAGAEFDISMDKASRMRIDNNFLE